MSRRLAAAAAAVVLSGAGLAYAATPGTYEGWLYKVSDGERWKGSHTTLTVTDTARGQRFRLSVYNMRLHCPYPDRTGRAARARLRFVQRGIVTGDAIDDTRQYPTAEDPSHEIRVRGVFTGRRFAGRIRVTAAPGVTGACEGRARVRVRR